eukprot:192660_1
MSVQFGLELNLFNENLINCSSWGVSVRKVCASDEASISGEDSTQTDTSKDARVFCLSSKPALCKNFEVDGGYGGLAVRRIQALYKLLVDNYGTPPAKKKSRLTSTDATRKSRRNSFIASKPRTHSLPVTAQWAVRSMLPLIESVGSVSDAHAARKLRLECVRVLGALLRDVDAAFIPALVGESQEVVTALDKLTHGTLMDLMKNVEDEAFSWTDSSLLVSTLLGLAVHRDSLPFVLKAVQAVVQLAKRTQSAQFKCCVRAYVDQIEKRLAKLQDGYCGLTNSGYIRSFQHFMFWMEDFQGIHQLSVNRPVQQSLISTNALATDGMYLYIIQRVEGALLKFGTGHGGTISGHLYGIEKDFCKDEIGPVWLACVSNRLFYRARSMKDCMAKEIDTQTLRICGNVTGNGE